MRLVPCVLLFAACIPFNQEAQEAHVRRMCVDPNYAYETGYNQGLSRGGLDTSWVETRCAPERAESIRGSYHAGYHAGMVNAPLVVKHSVNGTYRTTTSASYSECTFSSDCGDGQSCRSGQCMGNGWTGEACWFSSDCLSDSCNYSTKTCN